MGQPCRSEPNPRRSGAICAWWDADDSRLGRNARVAIQRAADVYVSVVSAWEIAIKTALGKLRTKRRPAEAVADADFRELALTFEHTEALGGLPPHHADPFDRLILAVAQVEGLTIVTSDRRFSLYDVPLLDAHR